MKSGAAIARAELEAKAGAVLVNRGRRWIELDDRAANHVVETVVQEDDAALSSLGLDLSPAVPAMAAKLEDIGEVRREVELKLEDVAPAPKLWTPSRS